MNLGLLILRVVVRGLIVGHGTQKLFGWFGGHGLDGTGGFFESVGHRPGRQMALMAGLTETIGGALLVFGFLTPLGAAMVIGLMIVAGASVHADNGVWNSDGGYELPLTNGVVATCLAFTGGGQLSIDAAAGLNLHGAVTGFLALVLAFATAIPIL